MRQSYYRATLGGNMMNVPLYIAIIVINRIIISAARKYILQGVHDDSRECQRLGPTRQSVYTHNIAIHFCCTVSLFCIHKWPVALRFKASTFAFVNDFSNLNEEIKSKPINPI